MGTHTGSNSHTHILSIGPTIKRIQEIQSISIVHNTHNITNYNIVTLATPQTYF